MTKHDLSRTDVAIALHLSVTKGGQTPAVAKWLANPSDKSNYRHMNDAMIELLELKLGERRLKRYRKKRN